MLTFNVDTPNPNDMWGEGKVRLVESDEGKHGKIESLTSFEISACFVEHNAEIIPGSSPLSAVVAPFGMKNFLGFRPGPAGAQKMSAVTYLDNLGQNITPCRCPRPPRVSHTAGCSDLISSSYAWFCVRRSAHHHPTAYTLRYSDDPIGASLGSRKPGAPRPEQEAAPITGPAILALERGFQSQFRYCAVENKQSWYWL